jgi:hypothetical protein
VTERRGLDVTSVEVREINPPPNDRRAATTRTTVNAGDADCATEPTTADGASRSGMSNCWRDGMLLSGASIKLLACLFRSVET